jgi:hypothetical protein
LYLAGSGADKSLSGLDWQQSRSDASDFHGSDVSGSYAYDSVGQELSLSGRLNNGALELTEMSGKQKTGKFVCKKPLGDPIDSECTWSKIDGTRESMVTLEEQQFGFSDGIQVAPKMINNRRTA